jgi:TonB family protein
MRAVAVTLALVLIASPTAADPQPAGVAQCSPIGDPAAAIRACDAIIQSSQSSPDDVAFAYFGRAIPDKRLGQIDQAISDYTQTIKISRNRLTIYIAFINRGETYEQQDKYNNAISDFSTAIALEPDQYPAYWSRGKLYQTLGLHDQAIPDFTQAIVLHPIFTELYVGRARSYEALDRQEEAVADYRAALKILPSLASAQDGLRRLGATAMPSSESPPEKVASPPPAQPAAAQPRVIQAPDWEQRPTNDDLAALYPEMARAKGVEGESEMRCTVGKDGRLTDCILLYETPVGFGFGRAMLASAHFFKMRPTPIEGRPWEGGLAYIPMKWTIAPVR